MTKELNQTETMVEEEICCADPPVDCCADSRNLSIGACALFEDPIVPSTGSFELRCAGRIIKPRIRIRVCNNKKVIMAVVVCDNDPTIGGVANPNFGTILGYKVVEFTSNPTPTGCSVNEVTGICFAIPGDPCAPRNLIIKVIAHYSPDPLCTFLP
ncbi:hypothetical protein [Dehalobacterium formicoaceticum]|uniref:DUF3992 domain-containing protein n=1 Tax=Dehalobacterium formicoaceticum TaxID=51515 RepID=A0ABT1Y4M5_9FIRM|nr:hypothetical protein [Dehalobacterium formicoaceticum]MCR6545824.1 hypothetical protein [Dehalobacterium formicoaceticum]